MKDNITEDQVFEDYEDGLPEDFSLAGATIRRKHVDLKEATVQIALHIDYALFKDIQHAAAQQGLPYEAFILQLLRDHCKGTPLSPSASAPEASH
jgi:predicted DNA binding CopG/RHH family protein